MQPQDQLPDMTVDDAAAALGFSTTLSDQMLQPLLEAEQMPVEDEANQTGEEEVPVEPQEDQGEEDIEVTDEDESLEEEPLDDNPDPLVEMEERITKKIDELGKSLKDEQTKDMEMKMNEIKETLKSITDDK